MRKVLSPVLVSVSLAATLALSGAAVMAQDDSPQQGGRLELVSGNTLDTLDNTQIGAVASTNYNMGAGALYEGLYHFTSDGTLEAGLADGLPEISDDGLVYTIRLKDGAMFAGPDFAPREVTAEDVAYGLRRALDPSPMGAPAPSWGGGYLFPIAGAAEFNAGQADDISGIKVLDPKTIQITLKEPSVTFLFGLTIATSWPVPQEAVEERGEDFGNRPVGAGPFFVKEWNKGSDITIARNPGYVDPDLPYLDEIHVALGVDEATQVLRIESGEADGVFELFSISPASLRVLSQNPDITITDGVGPRIFYLALNNDGVFADLDLRKAVAHAASKDFVAQFGGTAQPWNQLMSSSTAQSDPEGTRIYEYDPALATELVATSSYDGTPIKIVHDAADPYTAANSTALAQDLEAVGFTVELQSLTRDEFANAIYDAEGFDISSTFWSADYPDFQDYASTNFICDLIDILNIARFCDPEIDASLFATEGMPFGPERDAALLDVQQRLIDAVAGVPVMEVTPQVVQGPRVGAMPTLATYAPFDWKRAWARANG